MLMQADLRETGRGSTPGKRVSHSSKSSPLLAAGLAFWLRGSAAAGHVRAVSLARFLLGPRVVPQQRPGAPTVRPQFPNSRGGRTLICLLKKATLLTQVVRSRRLCFRQN